MAFVRRLLQRSAAGSWKGLHTTPKYFSVPPASAPRVAGPLAVALEANAIKLTVPLSNGNTQFFAQPTATVRQLHADITSEDSSLSFFKLFDESGDAIAMSTPLRVAFAKPLKALVNDRVYTISPVFEQTETEQGKAESAVDAEARALLERAVATLAALEESHARRRESHERLKALEAELKPMEEIRQALEEKGHKRGQRLAWGGLAFMGIQFGFMARLTWWDYSWDIMEPVTYFLGYGTSMIYFTFWVLTKYEFGGPTIVDRSVKQILHQHGSRHGFDVSKYNKLVGDIDTAEKELRGLQQ